MEHNDEYITLSYDNVKVTTEKAYLIIFHKEEVWIPKSQVNDFDRENKTFAIPEWLMYDKGLESYIA